MKHGEEGTHSVCDERLKYMAGKSPCCICVPHDNCSLEAQNSPSQSNQDPNGFELHEDGTVTNQVDDEISLCANGCYCMTHTVEGKCGKCKADKPVDPDTNYPDSSNSLKSSNSSIDQDKALRNHLVDLFSGNFNDGENIDERYGSQDMHHVSQVIDYIDEFVVPYVSAHTKQAILDEHTKWILPTVEAAHEYEQQENGSGIQFFDNERLGRLNKLKQQLDKGE